MFIPAAISLLAITLLFNFNLLTKEVILFDKYIRTEASGRVKGVSEEGNSLASNIRNSEIIDTENKIETELADSISRIIKNSRDMTLGNTTDTINYDDSNLAQAILKKREERLKNQPTTRSQSAAIMDLETGRYLYSKEKEKLMPIASITKLMSALVFLDNQMDWNMPYEIKKEDKIEGGRIILFPGEIVKISDLFNLSLVGSDNMAVMALVHAGGQSEAEFVQKMNEKARVFGMKKTKFADPTGIKDGNISTASELLILARESFANPDIIKSLSRKDYDFTTQQGRKKFIANTDNLLGADIGNDIKIIGGKTGYNIAAGYCFVGKFIKNNQSLISVALNTGSKNSRFSETERIVKWAYGEDE